MPIFSNFYLSVRLCALIFVLSIAAFAQAKVPAPNEVIGFTPGDDRKLASWNQVVQYFQKLEDTSPRVKFESIGKTTLERPFVFATISSPENLKNLEKYKQINAQLADPRKIKSNDKTAQELMKQGKTIVMITCGVHSNEVGSTLSSMLIAYRLASATDPETLKILDNTIILLVPSLNPDGVDIIKDWYDKTLGTPYEGSQPPELYHKYVGHDDNRDWYAFTQVETKMTVDKIHNVWHPQIVHDIHQQGATSARLFIPPYLEPVEPNVPKEMIEGYTELGNYMAKDLRGKGFQGITTDSTYDAWTPARAYSHYHGGVRILSETASARMASPVTIPFEQLRPGLAYDPRKETPNFSPLWKGGEWKIGDITNYMTSAAFSLMSHAANNREAWLKRFYAVGKDAVRPRRSDETYAYVIDTKNSPYSSFFLSALERGGVEINRVGKFTLDGQTYDAGTPVILMDQPYAGFAKAMLDPVIYPDLRDANGQPIQPYDVTAHSLALLTGTKFKKVTKPMSFPKSSGSGRNSGPGNGMGSGGSLPTEMVYKSYVASMDEGWTRWILDTQKSQFQQFPFNHASVFDADIRKGDLISKTKTIIFPDQGPNQILNGYRQGSMPEEYTGGVGKAGVDNLKKFVEAGGTLIFFNSASDFAVEQFNLPVRDVTKGLPRKDFFIPGTILRIEIDTTNPIAKGMPKESIAWFEDSPAFEIKTDPAALTNNFKIIARYPDNPANVLISGWALGADKIAGKAALVEFTMGKGKIVLFGFRPQYRGQSFATLPLMFNAIAK